MDGRPPKTHLDIVDSGKSGAIDTLVQKSGASTTRLQITSDIDTLPLGPSASVDGAGNPRFRTDPSGSLRTPAKGSGGTVHVRGYANTITEHWGFGSTFEWASSVTRGASASRNRTLGVIALSRGSSDLKQMIPIISDIPRFFRERTKQLRDTHFTCDILQDQCKNSIDVPKTKTGD